MGIVQIIIECAQEFIFFLQLVFFDLARPVNMEIWLDHQAKKKCQAESVK